MKWFFVNGLKMLSTKREWALYMAATTMSAIAVGIIVGLVGPFGTYSLMELPVRLFYWVSVICINWLLCALTLRQVERIILPNRFLSLIAVPLCASILVTIPATGAVYMVGLILEPAITPNLITLLWMVFLLFVAISIPAYAIRNLIRLRDRYKLDYLSSSVIPTEPSLETGAESLFYNRFDPPLRGYISSIESQDHYLVIRGQDDRKMIHCRMQDAERELGELGLRVHRSWWVAKAAIKRRLRKNGRHYLELKDGQIIPVSRSYVSRLHD